MKRVNFHIPYLLAALMLAIGELAGLASCNYSSLWLAAGVVAILMLLFGYGADKSTVMLIGVAMLGLALSWRYDFKRVELLDKMRRVGQPLEVSLKVGRVERRGNWMGFDSSIGDIDIRAIFKSRRGLARPVPGEVWRCAGWLARGDVHSRRRRTFWVRGVGTFARRESCAEETSIMRLRNQFSRGLGVGGVEPRIQNINRAIFLGERDRLTRELEKVFSGAGTMHVFAISGLHVMVVAQILEFIILCLFFPLRFTALLTIPLLWGYVYMIGMSPSAIRAAMMATIVYAAKFCGRRGDTLVAWALTFIIVHLVDPTQLTRIGSILSFSVMLGILVFLRWMKELRLGKVMSALGVTLAAWIAGTPISAYYFGQFTPGGLIANLVVIQLVPFSVVFSALAAISSCVFNKVAIHFNYAASLSTELMIWISRRVSSLPYANIEIDILPMWVYAAWYGFFILVGMWLKRVILWRQSIFAK